MSELETIKVEMKARQESLTEKVKNLKKDKLESLREKKGLDARLRDANQAL